MRVVTINTAKGDGAYAERLPALAGQLAKLRPDGVALQESFVACDRSAAVAQRLATVLGLHVGYATARRKPRSVDGRTVASESGLVLLTRAPLRERSAVALPWDPTDGERIAQFGVLAHPTGPVLPINGDRRGRCQDSSLAHALRPVPGPSTSAPHHALLLGADHGR